MTIGPYPRTPVLAGGLLWVASVDGGTVSAVDPLTAEVVRTVPTGPVSWTPLATGASVWVPSRGAGSLTEVPVR